MFAGAGKKPSEPLATWPANGGADCSAPKRVIVVFIPEARSEPIRGAGLALRYRTGLAYRPEIDGLRAISILAVLFFHLKISGFGGGYVGVDIFFVISGYLIGRNILSDLDSEFAFYRFYERRIRRLFPALFVTVALSFAAAVVLLSPEDLRDYARTAITTLAAVSNIVFWRDAHDYFVTNINYLPLLHTWSLSLEEQFYFVCPAVLAASRLGSPSAYKWVFAIAGLLSLAACQYWLPRDAAAVFYLAPFRVFEFAIGVLCIGVDDKPASPLRAEITTGLGLAAIAAAVALFSTNTPFPGIFALLPCLGAALIISTGRGSVVGRLLASRIMVGIGLISYSLYLCHWPIIVFARYGFGEIATAPAKIAIVALSFATALAMYRFVEQPFRRAPPGQGIAQFVRLAVTCAALTAALGGLSALAVLQDGWTWRLDETQLALREKHRYGREPCRADERSDCTFGVPEGPLGLLLAGDSHMEQLVAAFDPAVRALGLRGEAHAMGGCVMLVGLQRIMANGTINTDCRTFRERFLAVARAETTPIVIAQNWTVGEMADDAGKPIALPTFARQLEVYREALGYTIAALGGNGRRFLLIGAQVSLACEVDRRAVKISPFGGSMDPPCALVPAAEARARNSDINAMLRAVQREHPDQVTLLLPEDYLCDSVCLATFDGAQLYQDRSHFTVAGAALIGMRAGDLIRNFLRPPR